MVTSFSARRDKAIEMDQKIVGEAASISPNYVDLVSLASRQTMGSMEITVLGDGDNSVNISDVKIFVKDIGSSQYARSVSRAIPMTLIQIHRRTNPVDRLYAAFPAYLYLNASLCSAMLAPLLEAQDGLTGQLYASPDLGERAWLL